MVLLPDRALHLPDSGTLVVADLHLGKGATFRSHGLPVPGGDSGTDLMRLSLLLDTTGVRRLVLLGDLFHARSGRSPELAREMERWRDRHGATDILLIRGNHDRAAGDPEACLGILCQDGPVTSDGLVFRHEPAGSHPGGPPEHGPGDGSGYGLAGHLHPAVLLQGRGRERLRVPCFWFGAGEAVLPAFGTFTGSARVTPAPGDLIFAVGGGAVVPVPVLPVPRVSRRR